MKSCKTAVLKLLMFLPLLFSLGALRLLPAKIPGHYGLSGSVDRWGSKFEVLILPICVLLMGAFLFFLTKKAVNEPQANQVLTTGIVSLATLNVLNGYMLFASVRAVRELAEMPIDIFNLAFLLVGAGLIFLGSMPVKSGSVTKIIAIACGALCILLGLLIHFGTGR